MFDKIYNAVLAFLINIVYGPKVIYKDASMKGKHRCAEPSIIVSNHTCHLDGPLINTVFRKQKIRTLAAKDRFDQKGFGFFLRHTSTGSTPTPPGCTNPSEYSRKAKTALQSIRKAGTVPIGSSCHSTKAWLCWHSLLMRP